MPTAFLQGCYRTMCMAVIVALTLTVQAALIYCLRIILQTGCHSVHILDRSIYGLSYHGSVLWSVAQVRLTLRFPTPSNPHFCVVEFFHIRYRGPWASGRCDNLTANVRFPGLNQSWCSAHADGLAITVLDSEHIPDAIVRLRENLLRAIVLGKVQRLDHFVSSANTRLLWRGEGLEVIADARGYEVVLSDRTYKFGRLNGSLMRNWNDRNGRFTLSGENVLWYKAELEWNENNTIRRIMNEILCYPSTLVTSIIAALEQPASLLDLEVTSGDITFREFRDRDHSLEKHAMQFFGERKPEWMNTAFLHGFMWNAIQALCRPTGKPITDISQAESVPVVTSEIGNEEEAEEVPD